MSRNTKISAALIAVFAIVLAAVALTASNSDKPAAKAKPPATNADKTALASTPVVASDPRSAGKPGSTGVTLTEFLDFECEACGAAYPMIEQLRKEYEGHVTFNVRYFPIESHKNSRTAATAVEAAAQQDKFGPMYQRMFETQIEWGESTSSQADRFRNYAKDLGLDMKKFDADVADPKTAARIERDVKAGEALGVQGTPSFFINEERIEPQSVEDIRTQLDAAIAGS